jgi:hypothetical protein
MPPCHWWCGCTCVNERPPYQWYLLLFRWEFDYINRLFRRRYNSGHERSRTYVSRQRICFFFFFLLLSGRGCLMIIRIANNKSMNGTITKRAKEIWDRPWLPPSLYILVLRFIPQQQQFVCAIYIRRLIISDCWVVRSLNGLSDLSCGKAFAIKSQVPHPTPYKSWLIYTRWRS